jgi:uncharacterized protein (TIGR02271 family)
MLFPNDVSPDLPNGTAPTGDQPVTVPVHAEQLRVGKDVVETGRVRLDKRVHEREETLHIPLQHDEVRVERVPVNQYVETPPAPRYEGDTLVVPVLKEVIEKRLVLVEELRVTRRQLTTEETRQVTLRTEEVVVERLEPERSAGDAD